ncbi:MAG: hypothetical protein R3C28_24835 [Pirellulaceae bacterium]
MSHKIVHDMMDAFVAPDPEDPPFTLDVSLSPLSGELALNVQVDSAMTIGTDIFLNDLLNELGITLGAFEIDGQLNLLSGMLADFGFGIDLGAKHFWWYRIGRRVVL